MDFRFNFGEVEAAYSREFSNFKEWKSCIACGRPKKGSNETLNDMFRRSRLFAIIVSGEKIIHGAYLIFCGY